MTDQLRVLLEIGPKGKRIVAAAMDWAGLARPDRRRTQALAHQVARLSKDA